MKVVILKNKFSEKLSNSSRAIMANPINSYSGMYIFSSDGGY